MKRYQTIYDDPIVMAEMRGLAEECIEMGYNPSEISELMGLSLKNVFKKVGSGLKNVGKVITGGGGGNGNYQVTTPQGSVSLTPQGLNIQQAQSIPISTSQPSTVALKVEQGLKNPNTMLMVAGAMVIGAIMFSGKKRG